MTSNAQSERKIAAAIAIFSIVFAIVAAVPIGGIVGWARFAVDPDLPFDEFTRLWARNVLWGGATSELVVYGLAMFGGDSSTLVNGYRAVTGRGNRKSATRFTLAGACVGVILSFAYLATHAI